MEDINKITGKNYKPFEYYGHKDAEYIIVAMGSVCDTIEETIDYLTGKGEKVGNKSTSLQAFSAAHFLKVLPSSVKVISVLDRTKNQVQLVNLYI